MTRTRWDSRTLPRPGPIGRGVRLLLGGGVLYFLGGIVSALPKLANGIDLGDPFSWLGLGYALYAMPEIIRTGFSRRVSARRVRGVTTGVLIIASLIDYARTGSPTGGVLGVTYGLGLAMVLGMLGASFVIAAAVAAPG